MILLDTNVIVDATDSASPFKAWANTVIENAIADDGPGAAINAVTLAELCAASGVNENEVAGMLIDWGITILPVPPDCAAACGRAYRNYREKRKSSSGKDSPKTPLPDFFIGAHALSAKLDLATNDKGRFKTYFPTVNLITPG